MYPKLIDVLITVSSLPIRAPVSNPLTSAATEQHSVDGSSNETENRHDRDYHDDNDAESEQGMSQLGLAENENAVGNLLEIVDTATNLDGGSGQENLEPSQTSPELTTGDNHDGVDDVLSEQGKSDDSSGGSEYTTLDDERRDSYDGDDSLFRIGKSDEPLCEGDIIEYCNPLYVCGHPDGMRTTTVKSIRSAGAECPLVLENGEVLLKHTQVRRIGVMGNNGEVTEHKGVYREISKFRMKKSREPSVREGNAMGPALAAPQATKLAVELDGEYDVAVLILLCLELNKSFSILLDFRREYSRRHQSFARGSSQGKVQRFLFVPRLPIRGTPKGGQH